MARHRGASGDSPESGEDAVGPGASGTVDLSSADERAWTGLLGAAQAALARSYCPYSGFPVGAAALTTDGRTVTGANVENAAYGVTLCAECSLVSELFRTGGGSLFRFVCVDASGEPIMPCGRCRQLLHEHAAPDLLLLTPEGPWTMEQVLPRAFGPDNLGAPAPERPVPEPGPQESEAHD